MVAMGSFQRPGLEVADLVREFGSSRLGLSLGFTSVLHTWTRDLRFHPHIHSIVTAGGLSLDGTQWIAHKDFLLPVRVLGALFRGKLMAELRQLYRNGVFAGFDQFRDPQGFDRMMAKIAKNAGWFLPNSPLVGASMCWPIWVGTLIG